MPLDGIRVYTPHHRPRSLRSTSAVPHVLAATFGWVALAWLRAQASFLRVEWARYLIVSS
jgi:hypothetical protein